MIWIIVFLIALCGYQGFMRYRAETLNEYLIEGIIEDALYTECNADGSYNIYRKL